MKIKFMKRMYPVLSFAFLLPLAAFADDISGVEPSKRAIDYPWMSVTSWNKMHAEDTVVAQYDQVELLFIGDSITAGWDWQVWQKYFSPLKPANFGIGGDHTGNVLSRLQHGAIGNMQPKVIVLLIGVNNLGHLYETPDQVATGISKVVQQLQLAWPNSKILLNAILPLEEKASSPKRQLIKDVNKKIAKLGDERQVFFKDYGQLMLQKDGSISLEIMKDFLHPTAKGYEIWAETMMPDIIKLMAL